MNKDAAISKIKKCLALSKSTNQNEAATALRQAHALMKKHCIDEHEMLASEASLARSKASAKLKPSRWETSLASVVGKAFACATLFEYGRASAHWIFIGCSSTSEIAKYAFDVLLRQLKRERKEFIGTHCARLGSANKTARADLFCMAWVSAVAETTRSFAGIPTNQQAIEARKELMGGSINPLKPRDRNSGRKFTASDAAACAAGHSAGKNARLNHGVDAEERSLIGGIAA